MLLSVNVPITKTTKKLKKISIPKTVIYNGKKYKVGAVSDDCFCDLTKLKSVVLGDNVRSIGYEAFWGCSSLKTITLGKGLESPGDIFDYAFSKCKKLRTLIVKNKKLKKKLKNNKKFRKRTGLNSKVKIK